MALCPNAGKRRERRVPFADDAETEFQEDTKRARALLPDGVAGDVATMATTATNNAGERF